MAKIVTTFYRRVVVFSRSMDAVPPQIHLPFPARVAALQEKDLPEYLRFRPEQHPRVVQKRIDDGDQCFLIWSEGRIVHSGWVATQKKSDPYLRCTLVLKPGDIFLYDHYTHPSYRGRGLSTAREIFILPRYRREGYHRSLAIVAVENKPALRPFEAAGYHTIGMFTSLWWILGKRIWQKRWSHEPLPVVIQCESKES